MSIVRKSAYRKARSLKRRKRADTVPRRKEARLADHLQDLRRNALWREAERAGVFAGAPVDRADGYIHFSTAEQVPRPPRGISPGRPISCWWRSTPTRSAPRCATSPRAAAHCFRISMARCRWRRCAGSSRCRLAPTDGTCSRSSSRDRAVRPSRAAAAAHARPRSRARAGARTRSSSRRCRAPRRTTRSCACRPSG